VDRHVVNALGRKFGYPTDSIDGTLCNGGGEANHTAVLTALVRRFPEYAEEGARSLPAQPVLYVTRESHDTFKKAARLTGLGSKAVVTIPTDDALRMDIGALRKQLALDRSEGRAPFLVVATLGTTAAGIIDPTAAIADVAGQEGLWLHADGAWGGAAVLSPELRSVLDGVERADSITFDAHKWFSVPMTAGVFLTRHTDILEKTFRVTQSYMPREADGLDIQDPFARSMQWSRRFLGLKIFLSLAVAGWQGYAEAVGHMHKMGGLLKSQLEENGWKLVNQTPLPLACFVDGTREDGATGEYLEAVAAHVLASGKAWISVPRIGSKSPDDPGTPCLRACISNYRTQPEDLDSLLAALEQARQAL
jgi:glutamate/tyrosine decarboxylase-like PLP-dependent enzyme